MRKIGLLIFLIGMQLLYSCSKTKEESYENWKVYSGDLHGAKYSSLDQINKENVQNLEVAWTFETGDMRTRPATTMQCNPIIIDTIMFVVTPGLNVVALQAATGRPLWRFDPFEGEEAYGESRGVTYWTNGLESRLFFVAGSFLFAINPLDGTKISSFGIEGSVDLYEGLGREVHHLWVSAPTPGIIFEDLLILGSRVGEGPGPVAPGHVRAFDIHTGEIRWIFHTIPYPDEVGYDTWPSDAYLKTGAANSWGGFTLDKERGMVFFGTGSAAYDHYGGDRVGQNLFANCIMALDARSGERIWHYQVVHHDIWDYDLPCPPNLVTLKKDGKTIDAVAQPTKMGHLFVLNRDTGAPIFPVEEVPVPQSEIPGEVTWPTQPFPPPALRYAQQRFTEEEVAEIDPESTKAILERLKTMRQGGVFLPPGFEGSVVMPQFNGGTNWGGASFDPQSNMLYVNCSNEAEWISMRESKPQKNISMYDLGQQLYATICSACHGYGTPRNPGSPSLDSLKLIQRQRTREEIQEVLMNGKNQMPNFSMLTQDERDAVTAFLWDEGNERKVNIDSIRLSFARDLPYVATGHNAFRDPNRLPANKRPWGTLNAIDLNQGEILWQVPLGTYPELEAKGFEPTGTFNMGGPITTAGGLVFIGAAMDERFHAFDKNTGELLWEFQLDAGGYATPATYEVDGKQYVVIAAGGGGKPETKPGDSYYCFALP